MNEIAPGSRDTLAGILLDTTRFRTPPRVAGPLPADRIWIWAILLAVGWHAFWLAWLTCASPPARLHPPTPATVTYLPAVPSQVPIPASDVRAIRSPSIFSLPTTIGFSRELLARDSAARPPYQIRDTAAIFLRREVPVEGEKAGAEPAWAALSPSATSAPRGAYGEEPAFSQPRRSSLPGVDMELMGDLREAKPLEQPLPKPAELGAERTWELGARLLVGADGRVRHVFLVSPAASATINEVMLRHLYRWRFEPGGGEIWGRVNLRSMPGGTEARRQEELP